ncbi:ylmG homolog protein 2, chloroplastic [Impatiens glandulifera]|uniref:ylmG homolog protein 2, chloroplastic n=1 Tax=Impatiens glandulifera TaxID=253017 RepID=UPI001FB164FA|nr:ylmG homolog protein 2, chloroplastic [Impatiens glandulifera]
MESPSAVEVWRKNNNKHAAPSTAVSVASNPIPNGLARLFPNFFTFQPNPFLLTIHPSKPVNLNLNLNATTILSVAAERCFHMLSEFASPNNPLLINLFSLPSNFRNFLQICKQKNYRRRSLLSSNHNFAAILPGDSVAGLVVSNGVMNFLNIYNTLLVVRLVLTWFPNTPPAIVSPLSTLCDPYLNIFRGIIPPLGGTLDLSPILAFLVLNALTSTASALPAELPSTTATSTISSTITAQPQISLPKAITSSQEKWLKRMHRTSSNGGHEAGTR